MTKNTVPSPEDARKAALARREAEQNKLDEEMLEKRSLLFGDLLVEIEELMKDEDVDDVPRLEAALAGLRGQIDPETKNQVTRLKVENDNLNELTNMYRGEIADLSNEVQEFRKENQDLKTENGRLSSSLTASDRALESTRAELGRLKEVSGQAEGKSGPETKTIDKVDEPKKSVAKGLGKKLWANAQR